jgi:hypothetical protein
MSSSVVCGSEKSLFFGSANFWIVVAVAHCNVATDDLKRKRKNVAQVVIKLVKMYTVPAGEIILNDLIAHRENIRAEYAVNIFMKINGTTLNCHV